MPAYIRAKSHRIHVFFANLHLTTSIVNKMTRITLAFVVVVLAVAIQGAPASFDDIVEAAKTGNWEKLQAILNSNLASDPSWKPLDFHNIRDLKPPQGGQVYGEAEYTFESSQDLDGQHLKESGGHKIVNNNGNVKEFDFKPPVF